MPRVVLRPLRCLSPHACPLLVRTLTSAMSSSSLVRRFRMLPVRFQLGLPLV